MATTVNANFALRTQILTTTISGTGSGTVTSAPAGINCAPDCSVVYNFGAVVTLTATADANSTFSGWAGACSGTGVCMVTMNADMSATATFARNQVTLAVAKNGNGNGTVTSNPPDISCGTDCTQVYPAGTTVTLTATPAADSTFTGWTGGGCTGTGTCTMTITTSTAVIAVFTLRTQMLTTTISGTGGGTVTSVPTGINCAPDCSVAYNFGTVVTLTAAPDATSTFAGWSGACSGTGPCVVTMDADKSATAIFTRIRYTVTITFSGDGAGVVSSSPAGINCSFPNGSCIASFDAATQVTLMAIEDMDDQFAGWSGGGCSGIGTCIFTTNANMTIDAKWFFRGTPPRTGQRSP
jgi:hypothetical protein